MMMQQENPMANMSSDLYPDWYNAEHLTGTTIMAVEYDGGVIVGADARTTIGSYIANRITDKLTKVTDNINCCHSGSATDTQAIADIVHYHLNLHKVQMGEEPLVKTATTVFQDLCYNYRDQLSAGIIVAGWDKKLKGHVYSAPLGGMCMSQPVTIGGSGNTYLYGHVDYTYKKNMTKDECLKFVKNAVTLAIGRDGSSGGICFLASIDKEGVHTRQAHCSA